MPASFLSLIRRPWEKAKTGTRGVEVSEIVLWMGRLYRRIQGGPRSVHLPGGFLEGLAAATTTTLRGHGGLQAAAALAEFALVAVQGHLLQG